MRTVRQRLGQPGPSRRVTHKSKEDVARETIAGSDDLQESNTTVGILLDLSGDGSLVQSALYQAGGKAGTPCQVDVQRTQFEWFLQPRTTKRHSILTDR